MPKAVPHGSEPLRVGIFVSDFPIISETFVTTLAADLLAAGHDLRVMARDRAEQSLGPMHDQVAAAGLLDRLTRSDENTGRLPFTTALTLARAQPRRAGTLAALWALDRVAPRRTMAVTRHLSALAPFDIVHAQFATLGQTAQRHRDYGTLRTRALVVHMRGFDITRHVREHGPRIYDNIFSKAELFVANCAYFRHVAIDLGCPAERCVVIGSPIDIDRFSPPPSGRTSPQGRPVRLVAVGRLVEKKGFEDAIAAVGHLRDQGVACELTILGEGAHRPALEAAIAADGLDDIVHLHGVATQKQIVAALHYADIGIAPSVTAQAGDQDAPVNTLKEKMATGLPVIATRHGGIPELVIDGENGRLVPERDPHAIARAVVDLLNVPETWKNLGQAGRKKVVAEYSRKVILDKTLAAYRYALETRTA